MLYQRVKELDDNGGNILGSLVLGGDHLFEDLDDVILEDYHFPAQHTVARGVLHKHAVEGGAAEGGGGLEAAGADKLLDEELCLRVLHKRVLVEHEGLGAVLDVLTLYRLSLDASLLVDGIQLEE